MASLPSEPCPKKKKLPKREKKKMMSEKGKKSASARGRGVQSRQEFTLPAQWESETREGETRAIVDYYSPGKTKYRSAPEVEKVLRERGMRLCFQDESSESDGYHARESDNEEKLPSTSKVLKNSHHEVEQRLCVCESTQICKFVEDINKSSRCSTEECDGFLVPSKVETVGLGGAINITFACSGCQLRSVNFQGSSMVEASRRTVVGLALAVAFIVSGHGFSKFNKTLNQCLGIQGISKNRYYEVVKLIFPHIHNILSEMCEEAKNNMKALDDGVLGSWKRGVVTSDGVWHTRGHFSKNGSFIIKNYLTGGLLWFGHKCMKGASDDDELYMGTAKSMEGVLADECYQQAKDEGCNIVVVWQDGDSSSQKSVEKVFGEEPRRVFKCGGHVGRAHANNLKELSKQKVFSATQISRLKTTFPDVESAQCQCKRHSKSCGCLSDTFINNARINHFCCLQQCKNPEDYAKRMRALADHHSKNEHKWNDGECDFHPLTVCSCGKCSDDDEELSCEGKAYATKSVLKCAFHHLAYRIECELRAKDAEAVIHPEMGRGQSNLCEAHFSVLPHFRAKSQSLCRLHYIACTNCGLAQGNMSWCFENRGKDYHWVVDLYERLKLPIIPEVVRAFQKATQERMKDLAKKKTEEYKQQRISQKVARAEDQEERKKWVKRQAVIHTYGVEGEEEGTEDSNLVQEAEQLLGGEDTQIVSGRKCKCGSTSHLRTSSHSCPLNKKNNK